jgi:hypothetical protein
MEQSLVGFRVWRFAEPGRLRSTGMEYFWEAGQVNVAACMAGAGIGGWHPVRERRLDHDAPGEQCQCGFYAYDSLGTALYHARTLLAYESVVAGAVLMWGEVMVGRVRDTRKQLVQPGLRYRARFAKVLALRADELGERVAGATALQLVDERYLEAFARERGEQLRAGKEKTA